MRRWASAILLCAGLSLVVGCGGPTGASDPSADQGPHVPTQEATIAPATPAGRTVGLGEVGSVVVPQDATVEERDTGTPAQQLVVTFGDLTSSAVEITWTDDDPVPVDEQSWTMEKLALTNRSITDYERARVTWPGAEQSVLATWKESVALADGAARQVEGRRLVVQDDARRTVAVVAFAPEGEWTRSDAESVLLSLELAPLS